jgi:hypothetical protein
VGTLRFETESGEGLSVTGYGTINYVPNAHRGSLKAPVILKPTDNRPYKIIENDHVIIIRNNERYDVTGKKLQ